MVSRTGDLVIWICRFECLGGDAIMRLYPGMKFVTRLFFNSPLGDTRL